MGINVGYKAAGLNVGYAYFKEDKQAGSTIATNFNEKEAHTVAASYDFGMIKPVAIYQQVKEKSVVNPAKLDTFTVGATVVINPVSRVIGTYSMIDDKSVNAANLEIGQTEQFALGYSYDLSKRTSLYASLAYTSQDARAQKLGAAVAGADVKEYVVGVRHSF
jgi:predicted porin